MALPTRDKTWQFDINSAEASAATTFNRTMLPTLETL